MKTSIRTCDVLIIGGGSAGLRAAIEAHDSGANVIIISKGKRGDPHTVLARGGINAALGTMDPQDNWMIHAADTLREGRFIGDYGKVEVLCKSAPDVVNELARWGARFQRESDGRLTQRFFGAHTYRRTCFYGDWTGKEMVRVLIDQVRQRRSIKVVDNVYITKLLKSSDLKRGAHRSRSKAKKDTEHQEDDGIVGAIGIDLKKKNVVIIRANCIILAADGYSRVYAVSSSRIFENYGEGVALAFEAEVDLVDMEMVQFHPTGMVWPRSAIGTLATEAIRGEGGILLNSKGERFMKKYYPQRMELGPRDIVARANYSEILAGRGTKHGGVWLDVTHLPKSKILERLPTMYKQFKQIADVDISKEKMEVGPTAHYSMGGVKVDSKCETSVKGLFAIGEVAGQVHGDNRLGGNSLLGTVVFGKIAGREAANRIMKQKGGQSDQRKTTGDSKLPTTKIPSDLQEELIPTFSLNVAAKHPLRTISEIQQLMQESAGIVRDARKLKRGLKKLLRIKKTFYSKSNTVTNVKNYENLVVTFEVKSALVACEAVFRSALMREESRGAHYRSDFPKTNDTKWKVNIYCKKSKEKRMFLFTKQVSEVREPVKDLLKAPTRIEHHLLE